MWQVSRLEEAGRQTAGLELMLLSYNFESMGRSTKNFIEWGSEEKFITTIYKSQT